MNVSGNKRVFSNLWNTFKYTLHLGTKNIHQNLLNTYPSVRLLNRIIHHNISNRIKFTEDVTLD